MTYITPLERLHREISQPLPPLETKPARATTDEKPITLTRADVDAIIQRKRCSSPAELQYVIDHAKEFRLTGGERNQIGVEISIAVAQRARQVNGRRDDPNARFIAQVLGYAETPYGLIEREWVNAQLRAGAQSIARCKLHRPPECQCWSASRSILSQASADGEKTPEAWAATRINDFLTELELASRPERGPGAV